MPGKALNRQKLARAMVANVRWARRLGWARYGNALGVLLGCPWSDPGAAVFAQAVAVWQGRHQLEVDGIVGKDTWGALALALAPPTSPTGVTPPDAPPVPDGFDQIVATFGDPRPLMEADGTISHDAELRWQRQVLATGVLPFPIPLSTDGSTPGVKKKFSAHRKLVSTFVAVFTEIDRLGLRGQIRSWGGIYNFRAIRGAHHLSLHAFGIALDLNPESNRLGEEGDMSADVVAVFEHFGFFWGGNFRGRPDPMHFQYAVGY
jgi:D-alanyl-D-alanine carboxypeptidase/Putative peptidoglycan binding domain